jgi:GT2 family glycosyltransferase
VLGWLNADDGYAPGAAVRAVALLRPQPPPGVTAFQRTLTTTGACLLLRRTDFDAVGGFDVAYRNGCEDYDLCVTLLQEGHDGQPAHGESSSR